MEIPKKNQHHRGITLTELVVVVTIVLILASIAVQSSAGLQKLLQFNNAFQKSIFMVQRTRTKAISAKETAVIVAIDNIAHKITQYVDENGNFAIESNEIQEVYQLASAFRFNPQEEGGVSCGNPAQIVFAAGTGKVQFFCGGGNSKREPAGLNFTLEVCQPPSGSGASSLCPADSIRKKSFIIHRASGIPQVR